MVSSPLALIMIFIVTLLREDIPLICKEFFLKKIIEETKQ